MTKQREKSTLPVRGQIGLITAMVMALGIATPVQAAFPGANGEIVFVEGNDFNVAARAADGSTRTVYEGQRAEPRGQPGRADGVDDHG